MRNNSINNSTVTELSRKMMHTQYEWLFIDMSVNNEVVEGYGFNQTVVIYTVSISENRKENSFFSLYPSTLATWFQVKHSSFFHSRWWMCWTMLLCLAQFSCRAIFWVAKFAVDNMLWCTSIKIIFIHQIYQPYHLVIIICSIYLGVCRIRWSRWF